MLNKRVFMGAMLSLILILPLGCTAAKNTDSNDSKLQEKQIMSEFNVVIAQKDNIAGIIGYIDKNISVVSQDSANIMVDQLEKAQKQSLPAVEERFYEQKLQTKIAKEYNQDLAAGKIDGIRDLELKAFLSETLSQGYKVDTAEGMYYPVINYELYKKYIPMITTDMKDYVDIMAIEANNPPAKDAAFVIGWDDILQRALQQERFINKHNDSIKIEEVKQLYKKYVHFTFYGVNNTPLFSYSSSLLVAEAKNAFSKAVTTGGDTQFSKNLAEFWDLLKKNNYKLTDEVKNHRETIINKL